MKNGKRQTIGVLVGFQIYEGSFPNPFVSILLRGIQAAARDQGVNLMVGCGVSRGVGSSRHHPAWPEVSEEEDFIPIGPWNTDGLLILAPLRFEARIQYVRRLIEKEFPILCVGAGSGSPAIVVDSAMGIRQMMEHLVGHGHRRVAFIAGDEQDPGDSSVRTQAYQKGVQELGLDDDPRLIEYGQMWDVGGYNAMRRIMQSGAKFTAVMCSNDQSAIGVMRALQEAGLRIPWDVAVTGFDDHIAALGQVPPLTTVHYPLFETGYRSLLLIRERIEKGPKALPDMISVPSWIVARQSCGCLPEMVTKAAAGGVKPPSFAHDSQQKFLEVVSQSMAESLLEESPSLNIQDIRPLCDQLAGSFFQSLDDGDLSHFQIALIEILQRVETMQNDDAHVWQTAITMLHLGSRDFLRDQRGSRREERAEDMLHQARMVLSESARRRYMRMQLAMASHDEIIGRLTARLISSLTDEQIYQALAEELPQAGVRNCHIFFYEAKQEDPVAGSILEFQAPDAPEVRFESRKFPPPGLYPAGEAFNLAILPLFFREENLGYVAFDGAQLDPLATVVRQLSSAIRNMQLHQQVLELSLTDGLTAIHNRRYFEIILQKEVDRSQRYNRDLAVIMADIDRFKLYNDAFGHPAGDRALQEVAQCITRGARRGLDVVTRYGGEEFAVILPETDIEGAKIVAEHIRGEMAASQGFLQPTTISLGIASLRGDRLRSQLLVDQADRALYQAKYQGRDRAVVFEEWMQDPAHPQAAEGGLTSAAP